MGDPKSCESRLSCLREELCHPLVGVLSILVRDCSLCSLAEIRVFQRCLDMDFLTRLTSGPSSGLVWRTSEYRSRPNFREIISRVLKLGAAKRVTGALERMRSLPVLCFFADTIPGAWNSETDHHGYQAALQRHIG